MTSDTDQPAPATTRPDSLPENFSDVSALVKSLRETQAALTKVNQSKAKEAPTAPAAPVVAAEAEPKAPVVEGAEESEQEAPDPELTLEEPQAEIDPTNTSTEQAQEMLAQQGLDLATLTEEWSQNGNNLTEATYERLAHAGVTREAVALYAEGRYAVAAQIVNEVHAMVGGENGWSELTSFAASNLSAQEKATIDRMLAGGPTERQLAVVALTAKYEQYHGREGIMIHGQGSTADAGFGSMRDAVDAMGVRDAKGRERYAVDPAYRKQVETKIARMR